MLRREIALRGLRGERYFRWRGGDVSRIEGLTDAVIALAMTLLIVSLEVPSGVDELMASFRRLPAFAICFALLVMCWFYHYQFHRRFGLESFYTVILNAVLLFLILFYVYPLKFVFTRLIDEYFFGEVGPVEIGAAIMVWYSSGVVGIFLLFMLMHLYAYRHRDLLELNEMERHVTRGTIRAHLIHLSVGLLSILLALTVHPGWAGVIYVLIGPAQFLNGWLTGRKVERQAEVA